MDRLAELASCRGEKFGHNFPFPGGRCLVCGISQAELSGFSLKKPDDLRSGSSLFSLRAVPKPTRGIHTELQALVDEVRALFGETATKGKGSFGFYIGYLKRLGVEQTRLILAEVKGARDPKRLFWWQVGQILKKRRAKGTYPQDIPS